MVTAAVVEVLLAASSSPYAALRGVSMGKLSVTSSKGETTIGRLSAIAVHRTGAEAARLEAAWLGSVATTALPTLDV